MASARCKGVYRRLNRFNGFEIQASWQPTEKPLKRFAGFQETLLTGLKPGENEKSGIPNRRVWLEEDPDPKLDVTWIVVSDKGTKVRIVALSQTIELQTLKGSNVERICGSGCKTLGNRNAKEV